MITVFQSSNNQVTIADSSTVGTSNGYNIGTYYGTPITQINGNVGIVTNTPAATLDISGSIATKGVIYENAQIITAASAASYTVDYSKGGIFVFNNSPNGGITLTVNNFPSSTTQEYTFTLVFYYSAATNIYYANNITLWTGIGTGSIPLASATPLYNGAVAPTNTGLTSGNYVVVQQISILSINGTRYACTSVNIFK